MSRPVYRAFGLSIRCRIAADGTRSIEANSFDRLMLALRDRRNNPAELNDLVAWMQGGRR